MALFTGTPVLSSSPAACNGLTCSSSIQYSPSGNKPSGSTCRAGSPDTLTVRKKSVFSSGIVTWATTLVPFATVKLASCTPSALGFAGNCSSVWLYRPVNVTSIGSRPFSDPGKSTATKNSAPSSTLGFSMQVVRTTVLLPVGR